MPVYDVDDKIIPSDGRPCSNIKNDLIKCLQDSDCVKKQHKSPKECLLSMHDTVPDECYSLRRLFFECKRSLLDNRMRFRGHKGY